MNLELLRNKYINLIKPLTFKEFSLNVITVYSPLRVNFSAGWNDTPPYCNEISGHTLNAPILLNNEFPIIVTIKKITEAKIIIKNINKKSFTEITNMHQLLDCQSYNSNFALQKSAILASGLIPFNVNYNLNNFLVKYGGFEISASVNNIPIGSGLGTSSILIQSCIKAIFNFCNVKISNYSLFNMTACAEQIMNTGGGYQDQIGAYSKGVKFITFLPGIYPKIKCENLKLSKYIKDYLNSHLVFIYTGNTRVAKDLLEKIMLNYINSDSSTIKTLSKIGSVSEEMKYNLLNNNIKSFANNMIESFELNINLNSSFTNTNISNILNYIYPMISGYMLSGAGNGGFLTILLKENISKNKIKTSLENHFKNTNIKLYNFNLYL